MNDQIFYKVLSELNILMSHGSFKLLWNMVDYDLSGTDDGGGS